MPEGPSIVILREQASIFEGRQVAAASGNTRVDLSRLLHRKLLATRSWGKHFLMDFGDFSLRIHLLMFGSYRIDEQKEGATPRLSLGFDGGGELNFYTCSVQFIERPLQEVYDWRADVMSEQWDAALARKKLRQEPDAWACDAILDQQIFAGAGNIFKNEVLFRIRVHPLSTIGALPPRKLTELVAQTRQYGGEFLAWKRAGVLRQHWLAHRKRICPRCEIPYSTGKLGQTHRRSFYCEQCQIRYGTSDPAQS